MLHILGCPEWWRYIYSQSERQRETRGAAEWRVAKRDVEKGKEEKGGRYDTPILCRPHETQIVILKTNTGKFPSFRGTAPT